MKMTKTETNYIYMKGSGTRSTTAFLLDESMSKDTL